MKKASMKETPFSVALFSPLFLSVSLLLLPLLLLFSLHLPLPLSPTLAMADADPGVARQRNVLRALLKGLLLGLVALFFKKLHDGGDLRQLSFHGSEHCSAWRGAVGMEDVAFFSAPKGAELALVSSDVRRYLSLGLDLSGYSYAERIANQLVGGRARG